MINKNKYTILLKDGKGSYTKDPLKMEFEFNNQLYNVGTLMDMVFKNAQTIEDLKKENARLIDEINKAEAKNMKFKQLITTKVLEIEKKVEE